jgi:hypothetical protein
MKKFKAITVIYKNNNGAICFGTFRNIQEFHENKQDENIEILEIKNVYLNEFPPDPAIHGA